MENSNLISFDDFSKLFSGAGFFISLDDYNKFALYARLLVETNEKINLTAITGASEIAEKHFLDSVLPLKMVSLPKNCSLADVGTGAGFPGVPMAILRPDIRLTLIDSLLKRINFLKTLTLELKIPAECLHIRAEDAGRGELFESFDFVVARAVSRLDKLIGYCLPLVKVGGKMLALKGADVSDELDAARQPLDRFGGHVEDAIKYCLPNGDKRTLVVIKKVKSQKRYKK